jgi:hypothetical protein
MEPIHVEESFEIVMNESEIPLEEENERWKVQEVYNVAKFIIRGWWDIAINFKRIAWTKNQSKTS